MILQGRVTVDGKVVRDLATRVDPRKAAVSIDGQRVQAERMVYYAVNKPKGYVSTNDDPAGRPRVLDLLPEIPQRVYTVGRLDEMSVGLMILTNDGELANKLAHPKFGVEKVYRAVVAGSPTHEVLDKLVEGVWIAEGKVRARYVRAVANKGEATVLDMVLAEGKNREIRRMLAKFGHKVMALTRISIGPITLKGLNPGTFRSLRHDEVELLRKVADGMPVPGRRFGDRKPTRPLPASSPSGTASRPLGRPPGPGPRSRSVAPPQGGPPGVPPSLRGPAGPPQRRTGPSDGPPQRRPGGPPPRPQAGDGPRRTHTPQGGPPPLRGGSRRPPVDQMPTRRIIGMGHAQQPGGIRPPLGPPPSQRGPGQGHEQGPPQRRPPGPGGSRRPGPRPRHEPPAPPPPPRPVLSVFDDSDAPTADGPRPKRPTPRARPGGASRPMPKGKRPRPRPPTGE